MDVLRLKPNTSKEDKAMKNIKKLAASISVALPIVAHASNWTNVGVSTAFSVSIDADSIRHEGKIIKAWALFNYVNPQVAPGTYPPKQFLSDKQLALYNCDAGTSATIQDILTVDPDGGGDVITSKTIPVSAAIFADSAPDSIGEAMQKFVCAHKPNTKPHPM